MADHRTPDVVITEAQLIARQALEIANLQQRHAHALEMLKAIYGILYCIGGPLNDNKLGFTKAQRAVFHEIADHLL